MTDIALRYKLTFEDYLSAQELHAQRGFWLRRYPFLANWLYPLLGVCFLAIAFLQWRGHASTGSVLNSIFVGVLFAGGSFYVRWKHKSIYKRTGGGDWILRFSESNFLAEKQDFSKGEYNWSAVKSWRENAKVMLLYLAPALFVVIPKRATSEQQLSDLRALLARKVTRAA